VNWVSASILAYIPTVFPSTRSAYVNITTLTTKLPIVTLSLTKKIKNERTTEPFTTTNKPTTLFSSRRTALPLKSTSSLSRSTTTTTTVSTIDQMPLFKSHHTTPSISVTETDQSTTTTTPTTNTNT
jgi:hypothetical protein